MSFDMTLTSSNTTVAAAPNAAPVAQQRTPPPSQPSLPTGQPTSTPVSSDHNSVNKLAQRGQTKSLPTLPEFTRQTVSVARHTPSNPQSNTPRQQTTSPGVKNTHVPYNPSRPPPYTYQRQHEFPPFPPLTQHPVLPFLTTAFSSQPADASVPAPAFKPRPNLAPRVSTTQRHVQSANPTIPTMDVNKNDPAAILIRPPFLVPNVQSDPDPAASNDNDKCPVPGTPLTYSILHAHRNWFLVAEDFRKDNPHRIDYPPELEPPRGWAPLNECTGASAATRCKQAKEAKENERDKNSMTRTKGSYAQTETAFKAIEYGPSDDCHEKTILRCTFCRREYHGPNAKSMWRRHVYDKHKVAMRNRREGSAGTAHRSWTKKGKQKEDQGPPLVLAPSGTLDTPALSVDLTKGDNFIRLLEQVVAANLNNSLLPSVLGDGSTTVDIRSIALALEKSGIAVTFDKHNITPETSFPSEGSGNSTAEDTCSSQESSNAAPSLDPNGVQVQTKKSVNSGSALDIPSVTQKRKVQTDNTTGDRVPLKDNTIADRNYHNSNMAIRPGTPGQEKGKQKATPRTPGGPRLSQGIPSITSPARSPFTPQRTVCSTAMRARALSTTGHESYLMRMLSSPATASPVRASGKVTLASSPSKSKHRDVPSGNDDQFGIFGTSSPRYSFDLNISSASPYVGTFDLIPLEVSSLALTPASWTPPSTTLGPPAPLSNYREPYRNNSHASSYGKVVNENEAGSDALLYPDDSSPLKRVQQRRRLNHDSPMQEENDDDENDDEDFDMDAFVDLRDAAPPIASNQGLQSSPQRNHLLTREFSKEFGLLSQEEVERIIVDACPTTFEEEARSSKRRKVDITS